MKSSSTPVSLKAPPAAPAAAPIAIPNSGTKKISPIKPPQTAPLAAPSPASEG